MSSICAIFSVTSVGDCDSFRGHAQQFLERYGPDSQDFWSDSRVLLGRGLQRLVPEDFLDTQPLWTPDGSYCLVADIRLDNRAEVAGLLGVSDLGTHADSSLLALAWNRWGQDCLQHLIGAFAFAVWNPLSRELFAARDAVGECPLFYHRGNDFFALASLPQGLTALPGVGQTVDRRTVIEYFSPAPLGRTRSFFEGVVRLPPGHCLRVTADSFECREYWNPSDTPPTTCSSDQEYEVRLTAVLDEAIHARLRGTGSVGSMLSSGLDSSSVTAGAALLLGRQGKSLTAFTAVPQPGHRATGARRGWIEDEGPAAAETAAMYPNIDHVKVDTRGRDVLSEIKRFTDAAGEPEINAIYCVWLSAIFANGAERGIGTILHGQIGNTTISYDGRLVLGEMFRRGRWLAFIRRFRSLRRNRDVSIRNTALNILGRAASTWLRRRLAPRGKSLFDYAGLVLNPKFAAGSGLREIVEKVRFEEEPDVAASRRNWFEMLDLGSFNAACRALTGMDYRDPTADQRVFEFTYSIPPEQFIVGGRTRSLIRRAMKGRIPESRLATSQRGAQGADWYLTLTPALPSFREELAEIERSPLACELLDIPYLWRLLDTWPASPPITADAEQEWNYNLCRGIAMGYFLRTHDPDPPRRPQEQTPASVHAGSQCESPEL